MGVDLDGSGQLAVSNDATLVLDSYFGPDRETYSPHFQLSALSATGHKRWHDDFAEGEAWTAVIGLGNLDGPLRDRPKVAAGPETVVVYGTPQASVFDAATGEPRWETAAGPRDVIAADTTGGLFLASATHESTMPEATLRHLGPDGVPRWQTTWRPTATPSNFGGVTFTGAASTANDGLVVAGLFSTATLDLGGHILEGPTGDVGPLHQNFVAALDGNGATQCPPPTAASACSSPGSPATGRSRRTRSSETCCVMGSPQPTMAAPSSWWGPASVARRSKWGAGRSTTVRTPCPTS